jgi:hypothetical protein
MLTNDDIQKLKGVFATKDELKKTVANLVTKDELRKMEDRIETSNQKWHSKVFDLVDGLAKEVGE